MSNIRYIRGKALQNDKKRYNRNPRQYTGEFFKAPFGRNGIQIIVPTESEIELVNKKFLTELELGIVKDFIPICVLSMIHFIKANK